VRLAEHPAQALLRVAAEAFGDTGYLETPHGRLRWAARGRKSAPPLLVIHGLGDTLGGWAQAAPALAARYRVHLLDLPGHGLSDAPPDDRFSTLLAAVACYARRLRRPVLLGHSLGGWLAVRLAQDPTIDAAGLLLANPAGMLPAQARWEPFLRLVLPDDQTDPAAARRYLEAAFHAPPPLLKLFPGEVLRAMGAPAIAGFLRGLEGPDFLRAEELRALRLPVRLIWGESDRLLPAGTLDFFRQNLPAHRFVPLAGAGHLPHLEAPLRLARAVLAR
jgi:pimeloyl-ACP methyl ester carboxylesterase